MPIFEGAFWKYVWPLLWTGSTGVGIKLYIRDGDGLDTGLLDLSNIAPVATNPFSTSLTNDGLTLVSSSTSEKTLKNILRQRMYPHYHSKFQYSEDQIFQGAKSFELDGQNYKTTDSKQIFIFKENESTDTNNLKNECVTALAQNRDTSDSGKAAADSQYYKLKEWCTEPTIKAVLERHKLKTLHTDDSNTTDDDDWKDVISGGWFNDTYKNQQTFIDSSSLSSLTGITDKSNVTTDHIKILKAKCKEVLSKAFERSSFPAPKSFIDAGDSTTKGKFNKVDEFQEAALFCTKPETAKNYVEKAMHGIKRTTLPTTDNDMKDDFCLITSKSITDYENAKTNEPFEGKSFWCAVRILYEKNKDTHK